MSVIPVKTGNVYVSEYSISWVTAYFTFIILFCSVILIVPGFPKKASPSTVVPLYLKFGSFDSLLLSICIKLATFKRI